MIAGFASALGKQARGAVLLEATQQTKHLPLQADQFTRVCDTQSTGLNPQQDLKPAELLFAHRHHRRGAPSGTPEPAGVSRLSYRGCHLYIAPTRRAGPALRRLTAPRPTRRAPVDGIRMPRSGVEDAARGTTRPLTPSPKSAHAGSGGRAMTYDPKDRAITVVELGERMEANAQRAKLTAAQQKLLDLSAKISTNRQQANSAYLPRVCAAQYKPSSGQAQEQRESGLLVIKHELSANDRGHRPSVDSVC